AERDADQLAAEIVGPLVIGAHEFRRGAALGGAHLHAAVGAAIDEDVDLARSVAHRDHLLGAEPAAAEIARVRDLRLETDVKPAPAFENPLFLAGEYGRVGIDPIGDP